MVKFGSNNLAFTLAEVLITLGIVGVVAAMTLPVLIQNYQKQATATSLKKAYSELNQVLQRSIADNGDPVTWNNSFDYGVENWVKTYIEPYVKVISWLGKINPITLLDMTQPRGSQPMAIILELLIVAVISGVIYFRNGVKKDAF